MAAQGKRKSRLQGAQFRSNQRLKAMAMAFGVAMAITLGLLALVSSTADLTAEGDVGHVTRHLRELLVDQGGHGIAMEAQGRRTRSASKPKAAAMESQLRIVGTGSVTMTPATSTSDNDHGRTPVAMEALGTRSGTRKAGKGSTMMASSTSTSNTIHGRSNGANEELPPKTSDWMPATDAIGDAKAKAEEAEEIAQEAMAVAISAEEHAQAAEAAAEMSILTQVGIAARGPNDQQVLILGEIEDSKDSEDSEDKAAKNAKKDHGW